MTAKEQTDLTLKLQKSANDINEREKAAKVDVKLSLHSNGILF